MLGHKLNIKNSWVLFRKDLPIVSYLSFYQISCRLTNSRRIEDDFDD